MTTGLLAAGLAGGATLALFRLPPLHPVQLWLLPWAVASVLLALDLLPYIPLNTGTIGLIVAGSGAFCLGSLGVPRALSESHSKCHSDPDRKAKALRVAAVTAVVVLAVSLTGFLAQVAVQYGLQAVLVSSPDVRLAIGSGAFAVTIKYVYVAVIAATLCGLAAGAAQSRPERRAWLTAAAAAAASSYFSTGRSTIALSTLSAAVAFALARRVPIRRRQLAASFVMAGLLTLLIFSVGGAIIGKTLDGNALSQVRSPFTDHRVLEPLALPYQYATAPLVALDVQLQVNDEREKAAGCATFSVVCDVGQTVGLGVSPEPAIEPFTAEPLPWNTYTALDRPLMDGGPVAVPLVLFVLGLMSGAVFERARRGSDLAGAAYAVLATAMLFSSTQMNFFAPHIVGAIVGCCGLIVLGRTRLGLALTLAFEDAALERRGGLAGGLRALIQQLRVRVAGALRGLGHSRT